MDNIISRIAFQKSKSIMLIVVVGFSLLASIYSNIENYKAVATTTKKIDNQTNSSNTSNSTNISKAKK